MYKKKSKVVIFLPIERKKRILGKLYHVKIIYNGNYMQISILLRDA